MTGKEEEYYYVELSTGFIIRAGDDDERTFCSKEFWTRDQVEKMIELINES